MKKGLTADGLELEIRRAPVEVGNLSTIISSVSYKCQVVGNGISKPSTVLGDHITHHNQP